ncbi:Solute carrier family 12 member 1 [Araneus ventricosus]|uniref:Solute carrier family 12 member 1 n=1 Tax=Araneus ventricosus TaxID=182803 RepID=A0A4Y2IMC6_ARAVE|nr:Solute carrier family 12 member 1 [Araneus ventricosus]
MQQADLQWNRVSSREPSGPEAEALPLGHRGSWFAFNCLPKVNLAALLQKFRIPFTDLTVISAEGEPLNKDSTETFKKMISKFLSKDESAKDPGTVTRSTLNTLKNRTNQFLRLRELLEKHSKSSNLIVMTLPLPRKDGATAPLYLAWLDILTKDLPPFLLVRGNQTSVLTFYS